MTDDSSTPTAPTGTAPVAEPLGRVLAATDFSDTAANGVAWAGHVARLHGATLVLAHALAPPAPVGEFAIPPSPATMEAVREAAGAKLDEAASVPELDGVEVETVLRDGPVAQVILEIAGTGDIDLAVLGTRGLTGLDHLLLGSTTERVVQRAMVPVLSVHPDDAVGERIDTVVVPTDFSEDAAQALATADRILSCVSGDTRIVLVHVYEASARYASYGAASAFFEYSERLGTAVRDRLEEVAGPLRREGLSVDIRAEEGIASEVVVAVAEEVGADLVAMGTHGHSGLAHLLLGSTAERVVQHSPCPVLTVRRASEGG